MSILIKCKDSWQRIPVDQIVYITTTNRPHLIQVKTVHNLYVVYDTLHNIKSKSDKLMFCNKSVVINIDYIERIELKLLKLHFFDAAKTCFTCSRRRFREITKAWESL